MFCVLLRVFLTFLLSEFSGWRIFLLTLLLPCGVYYFLFCPSSSSFFVVYFPDYGVFLFYLLALLCLCVLWSSGFCYRSIFPVASLNWLLCVPLSFGFVGSSQSRRGTLALLPFIL